MICTEKSELFPFWKYLRRWAIDKLLGEAWDSVMLFQRCKTSKDACFLHIDILIPKYLPSLCACASFLCFLSCLIIELCSTMVWLHKRNHALKIRFRKTLANRVSLWLKQAYCACSYIRRRCVCMHWIALLERQPVGTRNVWEDWKLKCRFYYHWMLKCFGSILTGPYAAGMTTQYYPNCLQWGRKSHCSQQMHWGCWRSPQSQATFVLLSWEKLYVELLGSALKTGPCSPGRLNR